MRCLAGRWVLGALGLSLLGLPAGAKNQKPRKPRLELRAAPRMAMSPASVFFTAELKDGDDSEEFYCPALEWDWDDGARSTHEADCQPFQEGTAMERRFTAEHLYAHEGSYDVKVTLLHADRVLTTSRVQITVRPGIGDTASSSGF
jgi:PKD domain